MTAFWTGTELTQASVSTTYSSNSISSHLPWRLLPRDLTLLLFLNFWESFSTPLRVTLVMPSTSKMSLSEKLLMLWNTLTKNTKVSRLNPTACKKHLSNNLRKRLNSKLVLREAINSTILCLLTLRHSENKPELLRILTSLKSDYFLPFNRTKLITSFL